MPRTTTTRTASRSRATSKKPSPVASASPTSAAAAKDRSAKPTRSLPTRRVIAPRPITYPDRGRVNVGIGGVDLTLSNLGKVLYPECGFTKGDVIDYYLRVAETMLPHLRGYPVTLKRYPNGVAQPFFYEKRCPVHPEWVDTVPVQVKSDRISFCVINNIPSLIWLANLAALELHLHLARGDSADQPTMLVFDLDPGEPATIADCAKLALEMRAMLADLGLESLAKTSGSKGLHLYVPLNTQTTFAETKSFAHAMALSLERRFPDRVTSAMRKSELRTARSLPIACPRAAGTP